MPAPRPKKPKVLHDQLVKLVANKVKYSQYEVEDMLYGLALVLQDLINQDQQVNLKGVGAFTLRTTKQRTFTASFNGETYTVDTKRGVSLKADTMMRRGINRAESEVEHEVK